VKYKHYGFIPSEARDLYSREGPKAYLKPQFARLRGVI